MGGRGKRWEEKKRGGESECKRKGREGRGGARPPNILA